MIHNFSAVSLLLFSVLLLVSSAGLGVLPTVNVNVVMFHLCVGCQVEKVDARGVQLAALFMAGVDTALFINDVCGQPLPWEHCCPWGFFDGKLFQSKLARAARDRAALLDMCEGQVWTWMCLCVWVCDGGPCSVTTQRCVHGLLNCSFYLQIQDTPLSV